MQRLAILALALCSSAYVIAARPVRTELVASACIEGAPPTALAAARDERGLLIRAMTQTSDPPRVHATLSRGTLRIWVYGATDAGRCARALEIRPLLHAEPVTHIVLESSEGVLAEARLPR